MPRCLGLNEKEKERRNVGNTWMIASRVPAPALAQTYSPPVRADDGPVAIQFSEHHKEEGNVSISRSSFHTPGLSR